MPPTLPLLMILPVALQACAAGATYVDVKQSFPAPQPAAETVCTDPRPELCTQEYLPVCARLQTGTQKTYSNACTACADPAVAGYRPQACPERR